MADLVSYQAGKAEKSMGEFKDKWMALLQKQLTRMESIERELLGEDMQTLSVTGQVLMDEELRRLQKLLEESSAEHRQVHAAVSRCGRDLDRNFQTDLSDLIKNQKDIEGNPESFQQVNRIIFEHLLGLGRIDVATTFMKESELKLDWPSECDVDLIQTVMRPFRERDYLPAIDWVSENAPDSRGLLFRLHRQYILKLLTEERRVEALAYSRKMQAFAADFGAEISVIMFLVVHYPNVDRHQQLFQDGAWLELEEELAAVLCNRRGVLGSLLDVGASAVPALIRLQTLMSKRSECFLGDELPIEVPVPEHVHSTFTCPILKVQATDENPPMRLSCGHVITREALSKLAQTRHQKLKCPYCPEEVLASEAKQVYF